MALFGFEEASKDLIDFLNKNPLLKNLTKKEIKEIEIITHSREYKDKEVIIQEKEPGLAIYIIKKGSVYIALGKVGEEGKILQKISEGEIFGEMALFDEETRSVYVIASGDVEVLGIFKHDFYDLINRNKKIGIKLLYNIVKILSSRLRKVNIELYRMLGSPESDAS